MEGTSNIEAPLNGDDETALVSRRAGDDETAAELLQANENKRRLTRATASKRQKCSHDGYVK